MTQHDYIIDNQSAPNFRTDLNNALESIATTNSGGTAPSTTYAGQLWHDTSANQLKIRAEANDAWIIIAHLDQAADTSAPPDSSVTFAKMAASAVVTESESIGSNNNDTTIPTSAAVQDAIENNVPVGNVQATSMLATTAGDNIIKHFQDGFTNVEATSSQSSNTQGVLGSFTALRSCTVRIKFVHSTIESTGIAYIMKNGSQVQSFTITSGQGDVNRSYDISLSAGDTVALSHGRSGSEGQSSIKNARVTVATASFVGV